MGSTRPRAGKKLLPSPRNARTCLIKQSHDGVVVVTRHPEAHISLVCCKERGPTQNQATHRAEHRARRRRDARYLSRASATGDLHDSIGTRAFVATQTSTPTTGTPCPSKESPEDMPQNPRSNPHNPPLPLPWHKRYPSWRAKLPTGALWLWNNRAASMGIASRRGSPRNPHTVMATPQRGSPASIEQALFTRHALYKTHAALPPKRRTPCPRTPLSIAEAL